MGTPFSKFSILLHWIMFFDLVIPNNSDYCNFFFFNGHTRDISKFLGQQLTLSRSCRQHWIQAASATYAAPCSKARTLTHWVRPGIKHESAWRQLRGLNLLSIHESTVFLRRFPTCNLPSWNMFPSCVYVHVSLNDTLNGINEGTTKNVEVPESSILSELHIVSCTTWYILH